MNRQIRRAGSIYKKMAPTRKTLRGMLSCRGLHPVLQKEQLSFRDKSKKQNRQGKLATNLKFQQLNGDGTSRVILH